MTIEKKIDIAIKVSQEILGEYVTKYGFVGSEKYHQQMQSEIKEVVEEAISEYEREEHRDAEMARYYGDDYFDPYAYQQDIIDLRRYER